MSYWKDFTNDLSIARHGEELFDKILSGQGWGTRKADLDEDKEGVDLFANKDGKEITYQIKYGHVMQRTGNLAIEEKEVYDDFRKDKKGWGKKLTSDYVVFVEDLPNSLYYFNIHKSIDLKQYIGNDDYRLLPTYRDKGKQTWNRIVPRQQMESTAQVHFSLDLTSALLS